MITKIDALLPFVLAAAGAVVLMRCRSAIRGTTLLGPWCWTGFSLGCVALTESWVASHSAAEGWSAANAVRYLAATTTFCPGVAWLGAKRPQDRAWHLIVASLWFVLVLPAGEALLLGRRYGLDVADLRAWFLIGLFVVGLANLLPTRFWPSAVLWGAAQISFVGHLLPGFNRLMPVSHPLVGLSLQVVSLLALGMAPRPRCSNDPLESLWREFRDHFGWLWSLRVAERFTAIARQQGWPVELSWRGFQLNPATATWSPEVRLAVEQCFRSLLGRFVSSAWLLAHSASAPEKSTSRRPDPPKGRSCDQV